jgi:hypothetical protein
VGLVPGQGVTWVGESPRHHAGDLVRHGDHGVFIDYDESPDAIVVQFPGGRVFFCATADIEPDPRPPKAVVRRHNAT